MNFIHPSATRSFRKGFDPPIRFQIGEVWIFTKYGTSPFKEFPRKCFSLARVSIESDKLNRILKMTFDDEYISRATRQ